MFWLVNMTQSHIQAHHPTCLGAQAAMNPSGLSQLWDPKGRVQEKLICDELGYVRIQDMLGLQNKSS